MILEVAMRRNEFARYRGTQGCVIGSEDNILTVNSADS